jgi:hypothetical protein
MTWFNFAVSISFGLVASKRCIYRSIYITKITAQFPSVEYSKPKRTTSTSHFNAIPMLLQNVRQMIT